MSAETTGLSVNLPSIELPGGWSFGSSFNLSFPSEGEWLPELTASISEEHDGVAMTGSIGFNQKGLIRDVSTSAHMPNVIGTYSGVRAGQRTVVADWGETALAVSTAVAALAIVALVLDDVTGLGALDDPLLAPVMMWLTQGGTTIAAIVSRLTTLPSNLATVAGAATCAQQIG